MQLQRAMAAEAEAAREARAKVGGEGEGEEEGEEEGEGEEVNSSVTSVGSQATGGQGAHSARWIRPRKTGRSRVSSSCASFSSFKIHTSELISIGS